TLAVRRTMVERPGGGGAGLDGDGAGVEAAPGPVDEGLEVGGGHAGQAHVAGEAAVQRLGAVDVGEDPGTGPAVEGGVVQVDVLATGEHHHQRRGGASELIHAPGV